MEATLRSWGSKSEDNTDMLRIAEESMARVWVFDDVTESWTESALELPGDSPCC